MARTFTISDADSEFGSVNLIDFTSTAAIGAQRGGFGRTAFNPGMTDLARSREDQVIVERWRVNVRGSSQDNAASQMQTLIRLLRKAWINLDLLWAGALVVTGLVTLVV